MRLYAMLEPDDPSGGEAMAAPSDVAIIVPVRNEARTIERCLRGLLAQDYPTDRLSIVIVDDSSIDATVEIAQRLAAAAPNACVLSGGSLPSGWAGKPHACWRGALRSDGEYLCFLDADTAPEPALLRRAVAVARAQHLDMLSLEPFLELGSFWERLIIPAGLFAIACALDISRTSDPDTPTAPVNGQFLLVRRAVYFAVGGHRSVRAEIAEDSALALRVKQAGYRLGLYGADRLIRVRMYDGLAALWEGLSKSVTEIFGGALPTLRVAAGGFLLGWATVIVPAWVALAATPAAPVPAHLAFMVALSGSLTVTATQIAGARHFGFRGGMGCSSRWASLRPPCSPSMASGCGRGGASRGRGVYTPCRREHRAPGRKGQHVGRPGHG